MKTTLLKVLGIILGVLISFFGAWIMFQPAITILSITSLYIGALMGTGIYSIITYLMNMDKTERNSFSKLLGGIIDVMVACLLMTDFELTSLTLPLIISMWVILRGVIILVAAVDGRRIIGKGWFAIVISAVLMIFSGCIGFSNPGIAALSIGIIGGIQVMMVGISIAIVSMYID